MCGEFGCKDENPMGYLGLKPPQLQLAAALTAGLNDRPTSLNLFATGDGWIRRGDVFVSGVRVAVGARHPGGLQQLAGPHGAHRRLLVREDRGRRVSGPSASPSSTQTVSCLEPLKHTPHSLSLWYAHTHTHMPTASLNVRPLSPAHLHAHRLPHSPSPLLNPPTRSSGGRTSSPQTCSRADGCTWTG